MQASRDFQDLLKLMAVLRAQCPWDAKQTNDSLVPYALEEVYELVEAINSGNIQDIQGELGDVLLQVVFHAHLYSEQGHFDMADVIYQLMEKLIRRHPHVFEKESLTTEAAVKQRWQEIKALENQNKPPSRLDDIKAGSALMQAQEVQKTAAKFGFDWPDYQGAIQKVYEELEEVQALLKDHQGAYKPVQDLDRQALSEELGDCLFALVNVMRKLKVDSEQAALGTVYKFKRRFAYIEDELQKIGQSPDTASLEQMDALWEEAKRAGL